jgi:hypothetical protein
MATRAVILSTTWLLVGCGDNLALQSGVPDGPAAIDAMAAHDATNQVTADAPTPHVCSGSATVQLDTATPAAGAMRIGVFSHVTLDFTGPLDPAAVSSDHVALLAPHATLGTQATVSYDATQCRITITPAVPLTAGVIYRVRTSDLTSASNDAVADVAYRFSTVGAPWVKQNDYSLQGDITSGGVAVVDGLGREILQQEIGNPGPDGVIGTPDDHVVYQVAYTYSADGQTVTALRPGDDNMFGTPDDVVMTESTTDDSPTASVVHTLHRNSGGDITSLEIARYGADGLPTEVDEYSGVGADGDPFTDDDVYDLYTVVTIVGPGLRKAVQYYDPGPDGVWHTDDDVPSSVSDVVRDASGRFIGNIQHSKGPDGVLNTDDDGRKSASKYDYDATTGLVTSERTMYDPGADGMWLTDDDVTATFARSTYDADGNHLTRTEHWAGADGKLATDDDIANQLVFYQPQN